MIQKRLYAELLLLLFGLASGTGGVCKPIFRLVYVTAGFAAFEPADLRRVNGPNYPQRSTAANQASMVYSGVTQAPFLS